MPPSIPEIAVRAEQLERRMGEAEKDIDDLRAVAARCEASALRTEAATRDVPKLVSDMADLKLERAHEAGKAALRKVLASGSVAIFGAVLTLMGQYVLQRATTPDSGPSVAPYLTPQQRAELEEARRLYQRREGRELPYPEPTQRPAPVPPSAPAGAP